MAETGIDNDADELTDYHELFVTLTNPINSDTDEDGMPDAWETDNALNPLDPADASLDSDNDGLTNFQEYQGGTDPNVSDVEPFPLWIIGVLVVAVVTIVLTIVVFLKKRKPPTPTTPPLPPESTETSIE